MKQYSEIYQKQLEKTKANDELILELLKTKTIEINLEEGKIISNKGSIYQCPKGYLRIDISGHRFRVHRIMALAASGHIEEGFEVAHLDHNKLNNKISNLKIVSRSENIKLSIASGKYPQIYNGGKRSMSLEEIATAKDLFKTGWSIGKIARHFDRSHITIKKFITETPRSDKRYSSYKIKAPSGEVFEGKNLKLFARTHKLCYSRLHQIKKEGFHKGYSFVQPKKGKK